MGKLGGKTALVTGGTSGIGLAAAKALAKEGAHVYITGRRGPELAAAVKEIGPNVTGTQGDVSKVKDLDRLFERIKDEKGKLDILFANAGIAKYASLGSITEELYDSIFDINVIPQHLIVIGAGPIGLELAQVQFRTKMLAQRLG